MKHTILTIAALLVSLSAFSQQRFHHELPAGNYSGICQVGTDTFAVVDDKAPTDGFYLFRLVVDSLKGRIVEAENLGYRSSGLPNRDMEGVCYRPSSHTLFISGEAGNAIYEYTLDGQRTGRQLAMPPEFSRAARNLGLESLTYDAHTHRFYTTTERPLPGDSLLRIQAFGDDLQSLCQYLYRPDAPISPNHYHGVSELCATADGRLLVLERQLRVPRLKLGASTLIRIYEVEIPSPTKDSALLLEKKLVTEFTTRLTLTSRKFANYEGLCLLSPRMLLLVADSQNRFRHVLRDWFLVLTF